MPPTTTAPPVTSAGCATCGGPAVRSAHDTTLWVHEPTSDRRWALPTHRVVTAR